MSPLELFNTLEKINNASNPVVGDVLSASKEIYTQSLYLDDAMHVQEVRKCLDSLGTILKQIMMRETRIESSFDEPLLKLMNTLQQATQNNKRTEKRRISFIVRTGLNYGCQEPHQPDHPIDDEIETSLKMMIQEKIKNNPDDLGRNLKVYLKNKLHCLVAIRQSGKWLTVKGRLEI